MSEISGMRALHMWMAALHGGYSCGARTTGKSAADISLLCFLLRARAGVGASNTLSRVIMHSVTCSGTDTTL